jgi:uncharacterized protein YqeY
MVRMPDTQVGWEGATPPLPTGPPSAKPVQASHLSPARPESGPAATARARLQQALRTALRARDAAAVSALRSAQAAISNAEAIVPPASATRRPQRHIAGSIEGLGAAEALRRTLSEAETSGIIESEICERREAADLYERAGHAGRAARLRREADALAAVFADVAVADAEPVSRPPERA